MKHDLVGVVGAVVLVALAPIVADRVGKDATGLVEVCRGNAATDVRVALQPVLGVLVPEVEGAVSAGCGECAVDGVEGDSVDGEDVLRVAVRGRGGAVALETEVVGLLVLGDVLDGAATFDTANGVTCRVVERADGAGLPFQRRLDGLEESARVLEVDDVDPALGSRNDKEIGVVGGSVVSDVHAVDAVLASDRSDGRLLTEVPVLDSLVPATSDQHVLAVHEDALHSLDRLVVRRDLLSGRGSSTKIEHARSLVGTGAENLLTIF